MNKTVTMNISGIIFHIEEDAYNKLSNYLSAIKSCFQDSDGRDEIMSDIESRIAEMLQEKVSATKQVVLMSDVDHIISAMGQPEQFAPEKGSSSNAEEKKTGTNQGATGAKKRVHRNPDDKILGGVCSGISAYFGIDPIWLRLAFAVVFFVWGSGLLVYILLWILIPKAVTSAQKLEMRGENVNIDNIKRTVEEEAAHLKSKLKTFESEIKEFDPKNARSGFGNFIEKIGGFFSSLFTGAFRVIARIIGFVLIMAVFPLLFVAVFTISAAPFATMLSVGLMLLLGVPLVLLIYWGFKLLLQLKTSNRTFNFSLLSLWLLGICLSVYFGYQSLQEFAVKDKTSQKITLQQTKTGVVYIRTTPENDEKGYSETKHFVWRDGKFTGTLPFSHFYLYMDDEKYKARPKLKIVKSESDSIELIMNTSSRGKTKKEAIALAKKIKYNIQQFDSVIIFDPFYEISRDEKWRFQEVSLTLKLPVNKVVFIGPSMGKIIYDIDNVTNTYDGDMLGHKWIMTNEGLSLTNDENISSLEHKGGATREFKVTDFSKLRVSDAFTIYIKQGMENTILAKGSEDAIENIKVKQTGEKVTIESDPGMFDWHSPITLYITSKNLNEINLSGAVDAKIEKIKSEKLQITLSGASKANIDVETNKLELRMEGASKVDIKGEAASSEIKMEGASYLDAYDLKTENMNITVAGAGKANVNVSNSLKAEADGVSYVSYRGNPKKVERSASGVSNIKAD